jgi:predicted nucleotidyltransferase
VRLVIARDGQMIAGSASPPLPGRVQAYLEAIIRMCAEGESTLVSVILFGSTATGGFSGAVSDVDLILVLTDGASADERRRLRGEVERLEILHGLREARSRPPGALETLVDRLTANGCSFFVCTRGDLLSGSVARILDLRLAQAVFVDRVVIPSIFSSAVTVWGEDLLGQVEAPPIRRFDVFKAFFALACQVLLCVAVFPVLAGTTRYAMGALKRSVHNCFFCYHGRPAALEEEIDFFQRRLGPSRTLGRLLELRRAYRESFAFVVRCLPVLARLHLRTALDNRFPRVAWRKRFE